MHGRPRKTCVVLDSTPHQLNPTRSVRIDPDADAPVETTPVVVEDDGDGIDASQAHILKVLELMGCKDEHEHSVRRLPHIDIRCHSIVYPPDILSR